GYIKKQIEKLDAYSSYKPQAFEIEDRKLTYLINANSSADQSLVQLGGVPYPQTSGDVEQMRENIVAFRRSFGQHARNLQDEFSKIQDGVVSAEKSMKTIVS